MYVKRFLKIEKNILILSYILIIYTIIAIDSFTGVISKQTGKKIIVYIILMFAITFVFSLFIAFIDYRKKKELTKGICFKVLEKYEIKEQYARFLAIKKCIENYKIEGKKCNIKENVYVIEASIERDQAYSVVFPLMMTIIIALFIDKETIPMYSPIWMIMISLMAFAVIELVHIIPRNAFIKKVVEYIKKEHKI